MKAPAYKLKKINKKKNQCLRTFLDEKTVWQCCRKQGQNYLNVGRGGGEYICTQGHQEVLFKLWFTYLGLLRLYLKH